MEQQFIAGTLILCGEVVAVDRRDNKFYPHLFFTSQTPVGVATRDIAEGDMVLLGREQTDDNRYDVVQKASICP